MFGRNITEMICVLLISPDFHVSIIDDVHSECLIKVVSVKFLFYRINFFFQCAISIL